ncbi:MAG: CHRD domain-containing protein [Gemmatimonadaceae bacterium]|nr:CHRD domain-containing protein [Gemmatimonadaceae bacterium]
MRRFVASLPLAFATLAACSDDSTAPGPGERFAADLSGAGVVPAVTTTASGRAEFEFVGEDAIRFTLSVNGMTGITQAHLHSGTPTQNGTLRVWLLPVNGTAAQTPSVDLTGVIAEGDIARDWVRSTPTITFDSLKTLMRNGAVYVDIHTQARTAGEVRGQLSRVP